MDAEVNAGAEPSTAGSTATVTPIRPDQNRDQVPAKMTSPSSAPALADSQPQPTNSQPAPQHSSEAAAYEAQRLAQEAEERRQAVAAMLLVDARLRALGALELMEWYTLHSATTFDSKVAALGTGVAGTEKGEKVPLVEPQRMAVPMASAAESREDGSPTEQDQPLEPGEIRTSSSHPSVSHDAHSQSQSPSPSPYDDSSSSSSSDSELEEGEISSSSSDELTALVNQGGIFHSATFLRKAALAQQQGRRRSSASASLSSSHAHADAQLPPETQPEHESSRRRTRSRASSVEPSLPVLSEHQRQKVLRRAERLASLPPPEPIPVSGPGPGSGTVPAAAGLAPIEEGHGQGEGEGDRNAREPSAGAAGADQVSGSHADTAPGALLIPSTGLPLRTSEGKAQITEADVRLVAEALRKVRRHDASGAGEEPEGHGTGGADAGTTRGGNEHRRRYGDRAGPLRTSVHNNISSSRRTCSNRRILFIHAHLHQTHTHTTRPHLYPPPHQATICPRRCKRASA